MNRRGLLVGGAAPASRPLAAQSAPCRMLWAANVRAKPVQERLAAAAAAGFTHMSMFPIDYCLLLDAGMTDVAIGRIIRDSGVRVHVCDPFVQGVPDFAIPAARPADCVAFFAHDEAFLSAWQVQLVLRPSTASKGSAGPMCLRRCQTRSAPLPAGPLARGCVPPSSSCRSLRFLTSLRAGASCSRSPRRMSASPLTPGATSEAVWTRYGSGRSQPNVYWRCSWQTQRGASLTEDLLRFRMLPGEGEMDITGVTTQLKRIGVWRSVGAEVFADAMDALDTLEAARRAAQSLERWVT